LPRRRPWKLAREATTLDHLSGGRVVLGIGLGDANDPGFSAVGEATDARTRAQLVDESLAIIDGLWTGDSFSFSGRHFQVAEMTFLPTPIQEPRIPIWIGGGWPNPSLKRRAPHWDGICAYVDTGKPDGWEDHSPAYVAEVKELVAAERGSADGYDIVTGGRSRSEDWGKDRDIILRLQQAGATWWVEYIGAEEDLGAHREAVARGPLRP
jgi:alkanesulfonate monooxygenase SsuD/methylene tetrahydromethanopterin reductase-like flavin-dependent oxidoreductase (luciferase family)